MMSFQQSLDEYIESYHSRSGFSRARMGATKAAAFDEEAHQLLRSVYGDGTLTLRVTGSVVWGFPGG
jgi:hypothetical protein